MPPDTQERIRREANADTYKTYLAALYKFQVFPTEDNMESAIRAEKWWDQVKKTMTADEVQSLVRYYGTEKG